MRPFFSIAVVAALLAACSGKTDCPAFPQKSLQWLPYSNGQQVLFCGSHQQTFSFSNVYFTSAYTIDVNEACDCEAVAYCITDIDSVRNLQLDLEGERHKTRVDFDFNIMHYGNRNGVYFPMSFDNFSFSLKDDGTITGATPVGSLEVGGTIFDDVIMVEIDTITNRSAAVYRIYLAPNTGIIRYQYKDGSSFNLCK